MKMETVNVSKDQKRLLLLFDPAKGTAERDQVDAYLAERGLSPKRQYTEERQGVEYQVYYFGYCYVEDHLTRLGIIAGLPIH